MATNRADTLDPALLRPGRLDRKIEFPTPDRRQKRLVLTTLTAKMNLSEEVDLEDCKNLYIYIISLHPLISIPPACNRNHNSCITTRQPFWCRIVIHCSSCWNVCS